MEKSESNVFKPQNNNCSMWDSLMHHLLNRCQNFQIYTTALHCLGGQTHLLKIFVQYLTPLQRGLRNKWVLYLELDLGKKTDKPGSHLTGNHPTNSHSLHRCLSNKCMPQQKPHWSSEMKIQLCFSRSNRSIPGISRRIGYPRQSSRIFLLYTFIWQSL